MISKLFFLTYIHYGLLSVLSSVGFEKCSVMNQPLRYHTEDFYLIHFLCFIATTLPPPKPMGSTNY